MKAKPHEYEMALSVRNTRHSEPRNTVYSVEGGSDEAGR